MMNKQFEEIREWYKVNVSGDIYSVRYDRYLKTFIKNGYLAIRIQHANKKYNFYIHRLIADYYLDGYFDGAEVNHKDCDKLNNNLDNLEWVTRSENTQHAYDNNLIDTSNRGGYRHGKRRI